MLAFDDQALAQVFIAATAVEPDRRKAWLADIATRLDREDQRARGRRNTRAWRRRQSAGEVTLKFAIDEAAAAVGLVQHGYVDPAVADDPAALSAAAKRALLELCERSPPDAEIGATIRDKLLAAVRKHDHGTELSRRNAKGSRAPERRFSKSQQDD